MDYDKASTNAYFDTDPGASPNICFNAHPGALAGSLVGFAADTGGTLG